MGQGSLGAGKQLCGEGPGGASEQQGVHEAAACPYGQEGLWMVSWGTLGRSLPAGRGRWSYPSAQAW